MASDLESLAARLAARSENPEAAARGWARFAAVAPAGARAALAGEPALLAGLMAVFAASDFLTEALVSDADLILWLQRARATGGGRAREDWARALADDVAAVAPGERAGRLVAFRRREMLRIAWRDLAGEANLAETTSDLSYLADALLQQAYVWAWNDLADRFGTPRGPDGSGAELAVLGLGKLGGVELNYSSDIDLLFISSSDGETTGGAASTSNREFFARLAQQLIATVAAPTPMGLAYRVDLRLRPGGREGELVLPLTQARAYYRGGEAAGARAWELQMLIRARSCAGSLRLAQTFLQGVAGAVYPAAADPVALAAGVLSTREQITRQQRHAAATGRRGEEVNVKLDPGGIRDIEFLVQYLQRRHGGRDRWLRSGNTLIALQRLHDKRWLPAGEFQSLSSAYELLRRMEHRAQLRRFQQTHTLPPDTPSAVQGEVDERMREVRALYQRYLRAREVPVVAPAAPAAAGHVGRHWDRLRRSAATRPEGEAGLDALSEVGRRRLTLALEYSDSMTEALVRHPELITALAAEEQPKLPEAATPAELRRFHQASTLWLLAKEWEARTPIATALGEHTAVAEHVLQALARPPLAVLALGRLGLGELDLLSDLDLVFVAPEDARELGARLAAELIQAATAYTQEGSLYSIDTRLRPAGREGELVETPASLARFFRERAGWWEAASYLKARCVAGEAAVGEAALAGVRAAMGERTFAEPPELRDRMEREGHPGRWGFKTPAGGYFDVDFMLSRRWLARAELRGAAMPPLAQAARALGLEALGDEVEFLRAADHALRVGTGKAGRQVPASGEALGRGWRWLEHTRGGMRADEGGERVAATMRRIRELYRQLG